MSRLPDKAMVREQFAGTTEQANAGLILFFDDLFTSSGPVDGFGFQNLALQAPLFGTKSKVVIGHAQRPPVTTGPTTQTGNGKLQPLRESTD